MKVIAFHSKLLNKGERNYCTTCKELLAVNDALKAYHYCICGKQFLIHTNQPALKWLLKFRNLDGQLARWLELLEVYDFKNQPSSGMD